MVDTPQGPFACTRNKHPSNDDRTPHTGIGGVGGGCRRRRSFRHVLLSMQNHAMGVFSLQDGHPCHCFPGQEWRWSRVNNSCVMSMSLFSGTRMEMVSLLKVNTRLRRAQKRFLRGACSCRDGEAHQAQVGQKVMSLFSGRPLPA